MLWLAAVAAPRAATVSESFATNPLPRGWHIFGDTNLFFWNPTNQNLNVTWDSSRTNSYFYVPLGTILNRQDDFSAAFDLKLLDVLAGVNPNKSSTFQLALGFLNLADATRTNFFRGNGHASPNLVEFDFFPETGFSPTVWPSFWSTNSTLSYNGPEDFTIIDLPIGPVMRVTMAYAASNSTLITSITTNGVSIGTIHNVKLSATFTDFRAGAWAVESYSDAGQDPQYGGSLLAHGIVDNFLINVPPPPVTNIIGTFSNAVWQVQFLSRSNWFYTLERSLDLQAWTASSTASGNGSNLILQDANGPAAKAFYRVRAERP